MKKILILGGSGFLGGHLEHRLKSEGHFIVSAGRSRPKFRESVANEFHVIDLRDQHLVNVVMARHEFDQIYALASNSGGLGHIATGENDVAILTDSLKINMAVCEAAGHIKPGKIFFASSQCVYPDHDPGVDPFAQERIPDPKHLVPRACKETDASFNTFPFAQEKLFAETLYRTHAAAYGFEIRIGRLGNTYGPHCTWDGPRAKAVAALCRKVCQAPYAGSVELWGSGNQTRTFTHVDDAVEGMIRLMAADYDKPVNIASSQAVTIDELLETICRLAGKIVGRKFVEGPVGVSHRVSDNTLCRQVLNWEPRIGLELGLAITYPWIRDQVMTPYKKILDEEGFM